METKKTPGPAPKVLTQEQTVRLECVKLAYRPDRDSGVIIRMSEDLSKYVLAGVTPTSQSK